MLFAHVNAQYDEDVLIAAPGVGKRLRIFGWDLTAKAQAASVGFKDGASGNVKWSTNAMDLTTGGGILKEPWESRRLVLTENTALVLDMTYTGTAGVSIRGGIDYDIETV